MHLIKSRPKPGVVVTACGETIRDKTQVTTSRMAVTCEKCLKVIEDATMAIRRPLGHQH